MKQIDRFEGALLGVAIGDALGAPLEFMSAEKIKTTHGLVKDMIGGGWLSVEPGEVTDDTQMTVAVAEGIVKNPSLPFREIGKRFIQWYDTNPKDIGNTCRSVIAEARRTKGIGYPKYEKWASIAQAETERTNGQTAGNGALMRAAYPALYYGMTNKGHLTASRIAQMTHNNMLSTAAVLCYHDAIADVVAMRDAETQRAKERVEYRMQTVRRRGGNDVQPTGYVTHSAICAMDAIKNTDSFEDALVYAVNLGGDTDTIGAITGGLAGAIYGASAIPLRWINTLDDKLRNRLVTLADIAYTNQTGDPTPAEQFRAESYEEFFRKDLDNR